MGFINMRERERRIESWQCSEEEEEGRRKKRLGIVRGERLWHFNIKIMH
jgi:hypothetical protein